jgi:orotate phosphoribosyltransferase
MESCEHSALSAKHDLERRFGIKVHSMVNAEDILRAMENGVISSEEHREKLKAYLAQYKGE